jgi:hypothetical protein
MKKYKNNQPLVAGALACLLVVGSVRTAEASNLAIFDDSFSLFNGSTQVTSAVAAVWGTWSGGSFLPNQAIYANGGFGYADMSGPELNVIINRVDQTQYTAGTQMALAIFNLPDLSNWNASVAKAVVTDTSWVAPAWSLVGGDVDVVFTSNTTALLGLFDYNAGNEVVTMIPEPSTLSLVAAAGFCFLRRRKSS